MRKLILTFCISFVVVFGLNAQVLTKVKQDSLLQNILSNLPKDTVAVPVIDQPLFFNQNLSYKIRLDSIQQTVPLSYNEYVQNFIDIYTKRKDMFGKMLGLSNYYFPIFENALKAYQIPTEIKFLPIIESSMNPHAISRVGATGLWQFMFSTAKAYGLTMDNFVDERKDPIQASYAAAAYFRDAYEELGDWLLAIAAYNCGKGNVTRAIDKAGSRDFWIIRPFLPKETRDYVPAFIAAVYVMNYADVHQITRQTSPLILKTDTIQVNHMVALADLANAMELDEATLFSLNPSYKKKIINGSAALPKRVILPRLPQANYAKLYEVLNTDLDIDHKVILASTDDVRDLRKKLVTKPPAVNFHKVTPGQSLASIAKQYGVEVQDLKVWNSLKSNTIIPGQKLKLLNVSATKLVKPAVNFLTYTVKRGDTLSSIAEKFEGATVLSIKKANGLTKAALQPGMLLKIEKG